MNTPGPSDNAPAAETRSSFASSSASVAAMAPRTEWFSAAV